jgi:hypothetical protein
VQDEEASLLARRELRRGPERARGVRREIVRHENPAKEPAHFSSFGDGWRVRCFEVRTRAVFAHKVGVLCRCPVLLVK